MIQENYYYGQGKLFLAPFGDVNHRWIGDVSELTLNIESEKKPRKTSVRGRIVTIDEYITEVNADLSMNWHNFSPENLAIALGASEYTNRQSWTEEKFTDVKAGDVIMLEHRHVRRVNSLGLNENIDFTVDPTRGALTFINTPQTQPFVVDYDYAAETSIALLNGVQREFSLCYMGENLAENNKQVFVEFYRLAIDFPESIDLINNGNDVGSLPTAAKLLPDFNKNLTAFGMFGRIVSAHEFKTIICNGEIDFSHDFAY